MLYDRKETDFTFAAVRGPRPLSYFPEFVFLPPFCFVVTALRSATLVVLVCVGSLANHVSMVEDFKQRAFEDCRVTLGDTKDSLQGVSVVSDVTGRVRVSVCGVCVRCLSVSNDVAVKTITT